MRKRSKRYSNIVAEQDLKKIYSLDVALEKIRDMSNVNFDSSVDLAVLLGINPKYSDQNLRGSVVLPNGTGKDIRLLSFVDPDDKDKALEAGSDLIGDQDTIDRIAMTKVIDFDVCFSVPSFIPKLGKIAKILGTKGLMPNLKLGTVSDDFIKAIKQIKSGRVAFRADKGGIVHLGVGKASFSVDSLKANVLHILDYLKQNKPSGATKGVYFKKVFISSTMSPSLQFDFSEYV